MAKVLEFQLQNQSFQRIFRIDDSRGERSPWLPLETRQPTPVFLPGESHGQRSLVGYSPGGHKESDMINPQRFRTRPLSQTSQGSDPGSAPYQVSDLKLISILKMQIIIIVYISWGYFGD